MYRWLLLDVEMAVARKKDYYEMLGVKKNADDATLKKAYRKLGICYLVRTHAHTRTHKQERARVRARARTHTHKHTHKFTCVAHTRI